jgi:hypothetical protein
MIDKGTPEGTPCTVIDTTGGFVAGPVLPQPIAVGRSQTITMKVLRAPITDAVIRLQSSSPEIASVPQTLTLTRGATTLTFDVSVLRPGRTTITMSSPNLPELVLAPVAIVAFVPQTPVVPERVGVVQGETATFTVGTAPLVLRDTRATLVSADPKIAVVPRNIILRAGNPATVEVYGAAEGTTQLTISFDADAGNATVTIPVSVVTDGKRRTVH